MDMAMQRGMQAGAPTVKRLHPFERYLTVWVALCMAKGVLLGQAAPRIVDILRQMEFGSHVNVPMAMLIWLMITPMMMKVDFRAVAHVGQRPQGLLVTLFINWVVNPFSMALLA
jgi:ACR3 family arsenite transporter